MTRGKDPKISINIRKSHIWNRECLNYLAELSQMTGRNESKFLRDMITLLATGKMQVLSLSNKDIMKLLRKEAKK